MDAVEKTYGKKKREEIHGEDHVVHLLSEFYA